MSTTKITEYDIVFALHTGVTIMMQQQSAFDNTDDVELPFTVDEDAAAVHIDTPAGQKLSIQDIKPALVAEIKARGFFMIYELDGDDMVRCTPCSIAV